MALRGWLIAFVLTQLFEMPLYWRASRSLRVGFFASAITHPVVWFCFPTLREYGLSWVTVTALAETFAVLVEAWWLHFNRVRHPLAWSLAANGTSFTLGLTLRALTGWV